MLLNSKVVMLSRVLFYCCVIGGCYLAFGPANTGLQANWNDKLQHGLGFLIMAILAHWAHPQVRILLLALALAVFGLAIECVQAYLPHRQFSLLDWFADIVGLSLYFIPLGALQTWRRRGTPAPD